MGSKSWRLTFPWLRDWILRFSFFLCWNNLLFFKWLILFMQIHYCLNSLVKQDKIYIHTVRAILADWSTFSWSKNHIKMPIRISCRASLVAQWLGIRLPMQETQVRAPVREDPTCRGATRPVSHSYWACAPGACAPQLERPRWWEARAPRWRVAPARRNWRKPLHRNEDPTQPKIKNK